MNNYESGNEKTSLTSTTKNLPNVYLFLLDGYAKNRNLQKYWNYNNENFTDSLVNKGFYNVAESYTKYNYTIETITSLFTDKKIIATKEYKAISQKQKNNKKILLKLKNDPELLNIFIKNGYKFYNYFFYSVNNQMPIDYPFSFDGIFSNTIFPLFFGPSNWLGQYFQYKNDLNRMETIKNISKTSLKPEKPKFIFYHNLTLHYPFLLNDKMQIEFKRLPNNFNENILLFLDEKDTKLSENQKMEIRDYRNLYLNHLKKLNENILSLINTIQHNDNKAVILIMSDHGTRLLLDLPLSNGIKESFENISLIYLPNGDYSGFNKKMKPNEILKLVKTKILGN